MFLTYLTLEYYSYYLLLVAFLYSHLSLECGEKSRGVFNQWMICYVVFHTGYLQQSLLCVCVCSCNDTYLELDKVVYNEDALTITTFGFIVLLYA